MEPELTNQWNNVLILIPQITAGIIAFWLAFVIFRVGRVNELIDMIKEDLAGEGNKDFYKDAPRDKWTRERELVNWLKYRIDQNDTRRKIVYDVLVERINIKEKIYKHLNINLLLNYLTIVYCLILLSLGINNIYYEALIIALIVGIFSISYGIWSIYNISRM